MIETYCEAGTKSMLLTMRPLWYGGTGKSARQGTGSRHCMLEPPHSAGNLNSPAVPVASTTQGIFTLGPTVITCEDQILITRHA